MSTEIKIPAVGESITEVTIAKWLKQDGEAVKRDEVIAELESDKATFELPAEADGVLRHAAKEGETIGIGALIARIESSDGAAAPTAPTPAVAAPAAVPLAQAAAPGAATYATGVPSPAAGKILDEKGVAAADVVGSGRDGRITKEDAQNAQARPAAPAPQAAPASAPCHRKGLDGRPAAGGPGRQPRPAPRADEQLAQNGGPPPSVGKE